MTTRRQCEGGRWGLVVEGRGERRLSLVVGWLRRPVGNGPGLCLDLCQGGGFVHRDWAGGDLRRCRKTCDALPAAVQKTWLIRFLKTACKNVS